MFIGKKKRWKRNDRKGGNKKLLLLLWLKLSLYYFTYKIKEA